MIKFFNSSTWSKWWERGVGQREPKGETSADSDHPLCASPWANPFATYVMSSPWQSAKEAVLHVFPMSTGRLWEAMWPAQPVAGRWVWVHTFGFNSKAQVRPQYILLHIGDFTNTCICYIYLQLITWTSLLPPLHPPPPTHKSPNNQPSICPWPCTTADLHLPSLPHFFLPHPRMETLKLHVGGMMTNFLFWHTL